MTQQIHRRLVPVANSPTAVTLPKLLDVEIKVMFHQIEKPWHFGVVYHHVLRPSRIDRLFNKHLIEKRVWMKDVACQYTLEAIPPAALTHTAALLKGS